MLQLNINYSMEINKFGDLAYDYIIPSISDARHRMTSMKNGFTEDRNLAHKRFVQLGPKIRSEEVTD